MLICRFKLHWLEFYCRKLAQQVYACQRSMRGHFNINIRSGLRIHWLDFNRNVRQKIHRLGHNVVHNFDIFVNISRMRFALAAFLGLFSATRDRAALAAPVRDALAALLGMFFAVINRAALTTPVRDAFATFLG